MSYYCLLRDDQPEKKRNRFAIGCVEGNANTGSHEHARLGVALRHARVRDRDTMPQSRRAQLLAFDQAIQNLRVRKSGAARKQLGKPPQQLCFVRYIEIQMNVLDTQQFTNRIHFTIALIFNTDSTRTDPIVCYRQS